MNLHTREVREQANPSTSSQGTDAPGRLHASVGDARSSAEQTDWHDEAERTFDLVKLPVYEIEKLLLLSGAVG